MKKDINKKDRCEILHKWVTTIAMSILAIFAIIAFIVGSIQFHKNFEIANKQIELIETERVERLKEGQPILTVRTAGFTPIIEKDSTSYEFLLKYENVGLRPAYNISICIFVLTPSESIEKYTVIDKFEEITANPLPQNVQLDIGRQFKKINDNTELFIVLYSTYYDKVLGNSGSSDYYFKIPNLKHLETKKEGSLLSVSKSEKDKVDKYLKKYLNDN